MNAAMGGEVTGLLRAWRGGDQKALERLIPLVDRARAHGAAKRGFGVPPVSLDAAPDASPERASELIAVDDALAALSKVDPRKGRVVELRFFGGLSIEETAGVLKISPDSVKRDWRLAKLWLARELSRAVRSGS